MFKEKGKALIFPLISVLVVAIGKTLESQFGGTWYGDLIHNFFPDAAKIIGGGVALGLAQLGIKDQHLPKSLHTGTGFIGTKKEPPDENAEGVSEVYPHTPKADD